MYNWAVFKKEKTFVLLILPATLPQRGSIIEFYLGLVLLGSRCNITQSKSSTKKVKPNHFSDDNELEY